VTRFKATGINIIVAAGLVAAIGDIRRLSSPQKLVSYVGLNPRVRQSGLGLAASASAAVATRAPCLKPVASCRRPRNG
jgi:transposase